KRFLLRSISSVLNCRSSELICWLTADWVMLLICAVLVKLSVSAKSQNTFNVSICMRAQTIDGVECGGKRSATPLPQEMRLFIGLHWGAGSVYSCWQRQLKSGRRGHS